MKKQTNPTNELILERVYYPRGTNGMLTYNGRLLCYTIELPWHNNVPQRSCIPEGSYLLTRRYSRRFRDHLLVNGVAGRRYILLHPANDAMAELRGCIAPVTRLTGEGMGILSKRACQLVFRLVWSKLEEGPFYLTIQSNKHDDSTKGIGTNAAIF